MSAHGPILIIEDDEDDQYMINLSLERLNVSNPRLFFSNGQEALTYLEVTTELPFLILCDVNMPLMNGLELRQCITDNETLKRKSIPFVFFTTASNPELVRAAYDETVQGFFKKSTTFGSLQEQIGLIIAYWQNCLHPNNC
ncbi:response regulator receiver protein [Fibrella aestuarina BUZ 2]|uniref:Response regulator receiver protein n=1 Tax=Fibrella aestuarina BUZ 2 TaxID=1166018 RepID=I0K7H0_9BACT|nr:response regulator [Fibrella aestuarina]CCH00073.1 response regulator receiver protein [Fibrella aestuarina BUZ 2]